MGSLTHAAVIWIFNKKLIVFFSRSNYSTSSVKFTVATQRITFVIDALDPFTRNLTTPSPPLSPPPPAHRKSECPRLPSA